MAFKPFKALKNLLPVAAGAAANLVFPGSGALIGSTASALLGGAQSKKNAKAQQQQYADALRANRPTQNTPFGTSAWNQDSSGNWTQNVSINPADQARLDMFRQLAASRMGQAAGIQLPKGAIDYNAMGLGSLAAAGGIGSGTTGKRPWADSPYSSMGGNMLRNLQFAQPTQIPSWMNMMSGTPMGPGAAMPGPSGPPGMGRSAPVTGGPLTGRRETPRMWE